MEAIAVHGAAVVDIEGCEISGSKNPCLYGCEDSVIRCASTAIRNGAAYGAMGEQRATLYLAGCEISGHANSGVSVQAAANAVISDCDIFGNGLYGVQVLTKGVVIVSGSRIRDQPSGILVEGACGAYVERCRLERNAAAAVKAVDGGAAISSQNSYRDSEKNAMVLALKNAVVRCLGDAFAGSGNALVCYDAGRIECFDVSVEDVAGLAAMCYSGGALALTSSSIARTGRVAVQCNNNARLQLQGVAISHAAGAGLYVAQGVAGFARNSRIAHCGGYGAELVSLSGFEIASCEISENRHGGIGGQGCNDLKVSSTVFAGNAGAGAQFQGRGTAVFENCHFLGNATAIDASNGMAVRMAQALVRDSAEFGITVANAAVDVLGSEICGSKGGGISIADGASAVFQACTIHDNISFGAMVYERAKSKFVQCLFANNTENVALYIASDGKARCKLCKFEASGMLHIEARSGGVASVRDSELGATRDGTGVQVTEKALVKLRGSHVHNCQRYGVFVGQSGILRAFGGAIYECGEAAVALAGGEATAAFDGVQFIRNGGTAVLASEGSVTLANCAIKEHRTAGIVQHSKGTVTETNTEFVSNNNVNILRS